MDLTNLFTLHWPECCFKKTRTDPNDTSSKDKVNPLLTFVADLG